jgi:Holliday junction DNA helicase RuvB
MALTQKKIFNPNVNSPVLEKHSNDIEYDFEPKNLAQYIGQTELKKRLHVYIHSAKTRECCLDHMLLFGPPGLGKTTLASIVAREMDAHIKIASGPTLQKSGDLVAILSNIKKKDILFIDEIHRMPICVEETLYGAMEQFKIDIIIGQGPMAKTVSLPIQPFTLIGATTKTGLLSAPLRSRFGIVEKFDWYNEQELGEIIRQSALFFSIELDEKASNLIASCSRGTPRIAKKLMRRIRDYLLINKSNTVSYEIIQEALNFFGVMEQGLTEVDLKILSTLYNRPHGMPMGIEALAVSIGEEPETIEDVYEPFLMQKNFIERTSRGRIISHHNRYYVYELITKYLNK